MKDFEAFAFDAAVRAGVAKAGYAAPTPIQIEAIPPVMQGRDVMGLAQTGTGKTAAFALPILNRLLKGRRGPVRALIIAPTRELAEQIHEAIQLLGRATKLRSVPVYGGVSINPQIKKLKKNADIVVACPGRLLDHLNRKTVDLSRLETLVIDEADQMFDMGFFPDIRRIMERVPSRRQTLLFSATMPEAIKTLASDILNDPVTVDIGAAAPAETVSHALYPVAQHLKTSLLLTLLEQTGEGSVLVFTRTKHRAKRLGEQLDRAGFASASLQGNLSQAKRREAMDGFRSGAFKVLVATDIAARGIDVTRVSHVINYDMPSTTDAYIHRIGRTGRAAREGDAFTLVGPEDRFMVKSLNRVLGFPIERRTLPDFDYGVPAPPKKEGKKYRRPATTGFGRPAKRPAGRPSRGPGAGSGRPNSRRQGYGQPNARAAGAPQNYSRKQRHAK